jgi:glycosyltransferase involved in cell wall biosynthesis
MKKKIKVQLLASPHPQFDEVIDNPPEGVQYKVNRIKAQYHGWICENRITWHKRLMKILPIPRMAHTKTDADVVHSTRGIIQVMQKKPWIVDLECGHIFTSFNWKAIQSPVVRKIIMNSLMSKKCKRILPQSEAARKSFVRAIGPKNYAKIKNKVEVLYLAIRPCAILSLLGRSFYGKGMPHMLKAYEILTKKYDNLVFRYKGMLPPRWEDFAKSLPGFEHMTDKHLSRDELFDKMYLTSDIYVMPTNKDNYGVVFLEAMSAGLPIVATTSFTVPELVEDGVTGFLIKTNLTHENYYDRVDQYNKDIRKVNMNIVKQLVEKLSILIENKELREKMGKTARAKIEDENNKLNINCRNKRLREIYEEALE